MFRKLDIGICSKTIDKITKLQKYMHLEQIIYTDTLDLNAFKHYESGTDEYKLIKQYETEYTVYKQVQLTYKPILNLIPEKIIKLEIPQVHWQIFSGGSIVPPHTDKGRISTINLYTQVNNEKTIVYNKLRDGISLELKDGSFTNESFIPEWISEADSFVAQQWDAYALDISRPHAVINMTSIPRISISFSFYKTKYDDLVNMFLN